MIKTITDTDWDELFQESQQNGNLLYKKTNFEAVYEGRIPYIGNINVYYTKLRNRLSIETRKDEFIDDIVCLRDSLDDARFSLSFFLSGKVKIQRHGLTDETEELVGRYYSECNCDLKETEWWKPGEKYSRVSVGFSPEEFFQSFGAELEQIPILMRQVIDGGKPQPYYFQGKITKQMQRVLHEILQCPYEGLMKRMYLESRAIDLITLHFQQFQESNFYQNYSFTKDSSDIDRVHHAKEILLTNLENPPSLMELARQVGLNDFKLKRGFRQVFGTSAFKYLHDYRLERAWQLLVKGEMSVEEVALRVGFGSRSHFAVTFRKKFGLNPKQFLLNNQKSV